MDPNKFHRWWLPGPPPPRRLISLRDVDESYRREAIPELSVPARAVTVQGPLIASGPLAPYIGQLKRQVTDAQGSPVPTPIYLFHGCGEPVTPEIIRSFSRWGPSIRFSRSCSYFSPGPAVYWSNSIEFVIAWGFFARTGSWELGQIDKNDRRPFECLVYVSRLDLFAASFTGGLYTIPRPKTPEEEEELGQATMQSLNKMLREQADNIWLFAACNEASSRTIAEAGVEPTFFAFDAEMSMGIYGGSGDFRLHVHSTVRPLNIIYFDGQSAALTRAGTLDSQMAVLQGRVPLDPSYDLVYDEDQRALDLCRLTADLGIDGVVRMNAGFEILVCDFEASQVRELFITNNTVPNPEAKNKSLPRDPNRQPPRGYGNVFAEQGSFEWLRSTTWHYGGGYGGSGGTGGLPEPRVKLDLCRMVSFYDPALSSLAGAHHGGIVGNLTYENGWGLRRGHRLLKIDDTDVKLVRGWLKNAASPSAGARCSGVDWQAMFTAVRDQHGARAREIAAVFEWDHGTVEGQKAIVTRIHELSHAVLIAYVDYFASTPKELAISRCSSVYTKLLNPGMLARSEKLLYYTVKAVLRKLCRWEWELFAWSERHTTNYLENPYHDELAAPDTLLHEIIQHKTRASEILKWMGWDTWTRH
ncbi:hypothetical protein VTJ49DRAFT_1570 [Mycothermus thermophilus]|uniref:Uncharacterized protein n=1 Tax=Humicola insolens TaxID=85995 RepID=A0ABR3VPS3_HUMIN